MKNDYLNELRTILENHSVSENDIDDILSDYTQMYEEGMNKDMSDEQIRELLGEPKRVYEDLKDTLTYIIKNPRKNKFVALSPFIALIAFMTIGMSSGLWHPAWLVFLLIPISGVLSGRRRRGTIVALSPFISVIAFILIGYFYGSYEYAWLVFLSIPMLGAINKPTVKGFILFGSFVIAIAFYLYMAMVYGEFLIGGFGFILPFVVGLLFGDVTVSWGVKPYGGRMLLFVILWVATFILMGFFLPGGWAYSWQVLLLIPVTAIIISGHFRWVAIMPFVATIIFFSLGYFFGLFYISWLAFLLIPITGILDDHKVVKITKHD